MEANAPQFKLILGSSSAARRKFLADMGYQFTTMVVVREKPSSEAEARQFMKDYANGHAATVSSVLVTNLVTGSRRGEWDKAEVPLLISLIVNYHVLRNHMGLLPGFDPPRRACLDEIGGNPHRLSTIPFLHKASGCAVSVAALSQQHKFSIAAHGNELRSPPYLFPFFLLLSRYKLDSRTVHIQLALIHVKEETDMLIRSLEKTLEF
ncbi:hypothetical protein HAX54_051740 [Datura stramonium]|uniref:Maf-like protein n=1 Tax=Datura stramonium TaxID=4076 RepID=A0ABS8WMU1_DATST|nr:hypothetical protein [Datura stramonium]